jgi:DNA-binding NtrC family response regulator
MTSAPAIRVLVVDDEEDMRDLVQSFLSAEGYAVDVAEDGGQALALMERTPFDVVLSDVRMPRMGGLELLASVRSRHPETEVVLITGYANTDTAAEAVRLGAFGCLMKPFELDDLLATVRQATAPAAAPHE